MNGGKNASLRTSNTLAAITLLHSTRLLSDREASRLKEAYRFFRILEHRLQMLEYAQTHSLPEAKGERKRIAVRMALSHDQFEKLLAGHLANVRRIFNTVFTNKDSGRHSDVELFLNEKPGSEFSQTFAGRYRLGNNEKTVRTLRRMLYGTNLLGKKEFPERTRTLFKSVAEPLLEEISASIAPDQALAHCERILSSFPSPDAMYSLCAEKNFRKSFITICAQSGMLAKQFALSPGLAETVLTSVDTVLREDPVLTPPGEDVHSWKAGEECKLAVRYSWAR